MPKFSSGLNALKTNPKEFSWKIASLGVTIFTAKMIDLIHHAGCKA
jgi:hypothetical protein